MKFYFENMTTPEYVCTVAEKGLMMSIQQNDTTGVENILSQESQSININCVHDTFINVTPLMLACMNNKTNHSIVSILLDHGANPNISSHYHMGWTALHYACRRVNFHKMQLLLKSNANVNCQNECGSTPLHILLLPCTGCTVFPSPDYLKLRCI